MARTGPVTKDTSTIALGLAQIRVGDASTYVDQITSQLAPAASIGALANTTFMGNVDYWRLESGFPMLEDLVLPIRETAVLECAFKELTPANIALARGVDPGATVAIDASVSEIVNNSVAGTLSGAVTVTSVTEPGVTNERWTAVIEAEAGGTTTYSVYGEVSGQVLASVDDTSAQTADNGGDDHFTIPIGFFDGTWVAGETYVFQTWAYVAPGSLADPHAGAIGLGQLASPAFVRMEAVYTYPNGTNHMYIIFPRAQVTTSMEVDMQAEDNVNVPISFEAKRADSEVAGGNAVWDTMPIGRIYFD